MDTKIRLHLARDPVMASLLAKYEFEVSSGPRDLFLDLVESIVSQQLSVKASDTIVKRLFMLFSDNTVTSQGILLLSDDEMRAAGMSRPKISYVKGIAQASVDGFSFDELERLPDEEVVLKLTQLRGVGRWTAEMFLVFSLGRPDVFSLGDLGLRTAVSKLYKVDRNDLAAIEKISLTWSPYRSYASRLLWKSLDNLPST